MLKPILLPLFAAGRSHAYTRFNTTCTVPDTPVNFVSSPDSRGTLNILWSCLFTIFACTWSIQHLNIPEQRDQVQERLGQLSENDFLDQNPSFCRRLWDDVRSGAKGFLISVMGSIPAFSSNLKWMVFTILGPEFIMGKAIGDFVEARALKKKMHRFVVVDNVEWGLAHGFFAMMGGFTMIVREGQQPETQQEDGRGNRQPLVSEEGQKAAAPAIERGQTPLQHTNATDNPPPLKALIPELGPQYLRKSYILGGKDILKMREAGVIERLPMITTAEINDKSKANIFVKLVAAVQIIWTAIQVIVRATKGLAIAQLELVVTAFSVCAVITYIFLTPKPQGVQVPLPIVEADQKQHSILIANTTESAPLRILFIPGTNPYFQIKNPPKARIPNDSITKGNDLAYALGMSIGGVVFGAVHVAGWNLNFPTPLEEQLWHISSILSTCLLPIAFLPYLMLIVNENLLFFLGEDPTLGAQWWGLVSVLIYILARLALLVETFRALVNLPPGAFVSTWVSNIPNLN